MNSREDSSVSTSCLEISLQEIKVEEESVFERSCCEMMAEKQALIQERESQKREEMVEESHLFPLGKLPNVVVANLMTFLSINDLVNLSEVNKKMNKLARVADPIWEELIERDFEEKCEGGESEKEGSGEKKESKTWKQLQLDLEGEVEGVERGDDRPKEILSMKEWRKRRKEKRVKVIEEEWMEGNCEKKREYVLRYFTSRELVCVTVKEKKALGWLSCHDLVHRIILLALPSFIMTWLTLLMVNINSVTSLPFSLVFLPLFLCIFSFFCQLAVGAYAHLKKKKWRYYLTLWNSLFIEHTKQVSFASTTAVSLLSAFCVLMVLNLDGVTFLAWHFVFIPLYLSMAAFSLMLFFLSEEYTHRKKLFIILSAIFGVLSISFFTLVNLVIEGIVDGDMKWIYAFIPLYIGYTLLSCFPKKENKLTNFRKKKGIV